VTPIHIGIQNIVHEEESFTSSDKLRMEAVEMNGGDHITTNMEFKKRIVICGGGVMGASIAYHLAMKGVTSLVVGTIHCIYFKV
jgi:D-arabinose 5-phosphate isomerase GutQ